MEINKQIQLNHSVIQDGITIAILSGSLSIDSNNVGNISTSILNREYYIKFKSEVQAAIKEFYDQFFAECDEWNALLNTNVVELGNDANEENVDDVVEDDNTAESGVDDTGADTTESTE